VVDHTLLIDGTTGDDAIVLVFSADGTGATVDVSDGSPRTFDRQSFDSVAVALRSGDDQFHVVSGGAQVADTGVTVYGGTGDDTIVGGSGNDTLVGSEGEDDVRGGAGVDVLYGNQGNDVLDGGVGADTEFLGSGSDTALWVPGEGSDVVHGDQGNDTLDFVGGTGVDVMTLNATGDRALFTRDPGTIRMDLDSVESLTLSPLAGADRLTINGTDAAEDVDVRALAGDINVTGLLPRTTITDAQQADQLQINTLGGRDRVEIHRGVSDLIATRVDLGADQ
jgi:Ca2+-binding RTX toxin-like protein